jgi:hypothetical protein
MSKVAPAGDVFRTVHAPVSFSPFRYNLWRRDVGGPIEDLAETTEIDDFNLVKGRYLLVFKYTPDEGRVFESSEPIPFDIMGKKAVVEKFKMDGGRLYLQVNLIENPIPLAVLIIAGAAAVGVAGFGIYNALESLDRVIIDTSNSLLYLGLAFGVGYVAYRFLLK